MASPPPTLTRKLDGTVTVTSRLAAEQRAALEQLLFFNANQHRVRVGIEQSIATYGVPEIQQHEDSLRIRVGDFPDVQNLFAVDALGRPVGVAVFLRRAENRFVVLHLVVEPRSDGGADANTPVLLKLLHEIRRAARRTRGVERIELVYKDRGAARQRAH
jgi:hypothetical protein